MPVKENMTVELRNSKGIKMTSWSISVTLSQWLKLEAKISQLLKEEGVR